MENLGAPILTVREALRRLRPDVFTKGGDRADAQTIAEWDVWLREGPAAPGRRRVRHAGTA